jgi:DNA-binding PadR family transcriptional regulator
MDDPSRYLPLSPHQFHILLALHSRDRHGYGIIQDVEEHTGGALRLGTGTLYTAIASLAQQGLIAECERQDERRREYRLTALGRAVLRAETTRLDALVRHARAHGIRPEPSTGSKRS